jgi:uncharacterized protein (DUF885 family)
MDDAARLARLAEDHWEAGKQEAPTMATLLGDHRYDDRLDALDPGSVQARRDRLAATAAAARALEPDGSDDRLTRDLLVHETEQAVAVLDLEVQTAPVDPFLGMHTRLVQTATQTVATTAEQADALLRRHEQVPRLLEEAAALNRDRLARGLTPAALSVRRVVVQLEGYLAGDLDADPFLGIVVPDEVAAAWRPRMRRVVEDSVRPAYAAHLEFVRDEVLPVARDDDHPGLLHQPGGAERYATLARFHTSLDVDPDEVHEIGREDAEVRLPEEWAATGEAALGVTDLPTLFDRLRSDPDLRYADAEEMVRHAEEVVARAWASIDGWFDARPVAPCRVRPVPEALAPAMPPAYYYPPAEDGSRPGTYFVNTHAAQERGRYMYEAIAFHEAIPGHHFDRTLAQELTDVPDFRRYGSNTAHAEGWGLYTERLADEMGLYSTQLDRLGMLAADAWRAGRLVVDTGLHARGWTREQAVDWMMRWTPVSRGVVEQEVDRYVGMAGQALAYKMGQRHLFGLRDEARGALGDAFDLPSFHDAVLVRGGMPLTVLTASVREQLGL